MSEPVVGGADPTGRANVADVIAAAERGDDPLCRASAQRRIRVIWNTNAGHKAGLPMHTDGEDELRRLMHKYGLGDDLVASQSQEEAVAAIGDAREHGYDTIVAAGGDGTVGLAARHLLGSDTALGVMPLGSVMNVARQLGIPRNLEVGAAIVALGRTRRVDVGVARDNVFLESAAVGMNAAIFSQLGKVDRGVWLALPKAVQQAFRYRPAHMTVELDRGRVRSRTLLVTVSIGPYNGPGMTVAPEAKVDDGLFDVTVFRHYSKLELIRHLVSIAFGRHAYSPHLRIYRSAHVRIDGNRRLPVRADGDDVGRTPIDFQIKRGVLLVVAPAELTTPPEPGIAAPLKRGAAILGGGGRPAEPITPLTCLDGQSTWATRALGCEVGDRLAPTLLAHRRGVAR